MNNSLKNQVAVLTLAVRLETINDWTPIYKIEEDDYGYDILCQVTGSYEIHRVSRIEVDDLPKSDYSATSLMEMAVRAITEADGVMINFEKCIQQNRVPSY